MNDSKSWYMFFPFLFALLISGCGPTDNSDANNDGSQPFYLDPTANAHISHAFLKKVVSAVSTAHGKKTLKIWVDRESMGEGCIKRKCVTQEMVDLLAEAFLRPGTDNDIYDWDTAIYGEEWGDAARDEHTSLIASSNEINILLTDIDGDDNPARGTIGYFYPKDNFTHEALSGSNERIMFYIDSVMFANDQGGNAGWDIHDRYPSETLSTLAHEFQHMIHFYQKTILLSADNTSTEIWINEMLSEATEDLVATRIGIDGPRAVPYTEGGAGEPDNRYGRYPQFNRVGSQLSLTQWHQNIAEYSKVSAFGTFLMRNYGGAKVLHDIMYNTYTDKQAILDAVHKFPYAESVTFDTLLRDWGTAILLSDQTTLPAGLPRYNTGKFHDTSYNNISYQLGSINFFNYTPGPILYHGSGTTILPPMSNLFYTVGENIKGDYNLSLDIKKWTTATLIIKNTGSQGSSTNSDTSVQISGSTADRNITVTAGDDPSASYLANQGHVNLFLHLGARSRDVYLLLSNSENTESDNETSIQNGRMSAKNRQLGARQTPRSKLAATPPSGMAQQVHDFTHHITDYLHPIQSNTKEAQ